MNMASLYCICFLLRFYEHTTCVLGNGVALNIPNLIKEIKELTDHGVSKPNVLVSDRAHVVMPYHILLDEYEEERLAGKSFGSTKSVSHHVFQISMLK